MRLGTGGGGRRVTAGSGEGVRERSNTFESFGRDKEKGFFSGATSGSGGGASQNVMVDADSARRVSPTL
jgi:hypothetical protein